MKKISILAGLFVCGLMLLAADISGTWLASVTLDAGSGTATFVLKQSGETLSGTYSGALGESQVSGTVKGSNVEWSFENADAGKCTYTGKLEGGKITGTVVYGQLGKGTFTAEKK